MLVNTPDVDAPVEPAGLELVQVVGDIAHIIRRDPVLTDQNVILFAAVIGGSEPDCAVFFVNRARFFKHVQRLVPLRRCLTGSAPRTRRRIGSRSPPDAVHAFKILLKRVIDKNLRAAPAAELSALPRFPDAPQGIPSHVL